MTDDELEALIDASVAKHLSSVATTLRRDLSAEIRGHLASSERSLSENVRRLRDRLSTLSCDTSHSLEAIVSRIDDLERLQADRHAALLAAREDDLKNLVALVDTNIEKTFASFTSAKVKAIMRREAASHDGNEGSG